MDYLLATAADVPPMTVDRIESPSIDAAGGFRGVGEGGVIGAVPALTNAVADTLAGLGVNVNRTPPPPDRVLALIEDSNKREPRRRDETEGRAKP